VLGTRHLPKLGAHLITALELRATASAPRSRTCDA
jgi:hypothetical protein